MLQTLTPWKILVLLIFLLIYGDAIYLVFSILLKMVKLFYRAKGFATKICIFWSSSKTKQNGAQTLVRQNFISTV